MINGKRVVALIPARGGSKSVPLKNIKELAGKPLIAWSIEIAKKVHEIDRVIVSTDDERIAKVALHYGAEVFNRPKELAQDNSLVIDTIRYVLRTLKRSGDLYEYLVLLEPTAPLRKDIDVINCLLLIEQKQYDSVATFTEATLNPHRAWKIDGYTPRVFIEGAIPWLPRQRLPKAYQLNGAVYVIRVDAINEQSISVLVGNVGAVVMPTERSVDIDKNIDFLIVEALMKNRKTVMEEIAGQ